MVSVVECVLVWYMLVGVLIVSVMLYYCMEVVEVGIFC